MKKDIAGKFLEAFIQPDFDLKKFTAPYDKGAYAFYKFVDALKDTKVEVLDEALIKKFLRSLSIEKWLWGRYLNSSLSIYDLINELSTLNAKAHHRLHDINVWIRRRNGWILLQAFAMAALVSLVVLFPPVAMIGISGITYLIATIGLIPAFGLFTAIFALGATLFPAYFTVFDLSDDIAKLSFYERFKSNFFSIIRFLVNGVAYGFVLAAATTNTVVGGLFVVAAFAEIIQQSYNWMTHPEKKQEPTSTEPLQRLYEKENNDRKRFDYKHTRNAILVTLSQALLMTIIVAFWSFVPGGVIISAISITAMGAVMLGKYLADQKNDAWKIDILNKKFQLDENKYIDLMSGSEQNVKCAATETLSKEVQHHPALFPDVDYPENKDSELSIRKTLNNR